MYVRMLPVIAVLVVCGCLEAPRDALRLRPDPHRDVARPLTEEEKAQWQTLCKRMRAEKCDGLRLAVLTQDGKWQVRCLFVEFESRKTRYIWEFAPGTGGDEKTMRKDAAELAFRVDYRCVALLDMFDENEPRFVVWYYYDGKTVKELPAPPTPDIAARATQYILQLQRRAREIR
jgi:hypothetical protein